MQRQGPKGAPIAELGLNVDADVVAIAGEIVAWRRRLHQGPELGFQEKWTGAFVADKLRSFGVEVIEGCGQTGLVGLIQGSGPGPCIGLRSDMDGLPLHEAPSEFNQDYISQNQGTMHGCGHDGHMAMLLAVAKLLAAKKHLMRGSVKLIFQPNEENVCGAKAMIEDGVMLAGRFGPKVDQVYGIHLIAAMPTGAVGVRDGPLMAASDRLRIIIEGPGGHGGMAAGIPDTILAASHLVNQLQTVVARDINPLDPAVISICYLQAGDGGFNVLPSRLEMRGTVRNFSTEVQALLRDRILELCAGVARSFRVKITPEYLPVTPCTDNTSPEHVQKIRAAATLVVGQERTLATPPVMGAEDFSEFLLRAPGCFIFVGASLKQTSPPGSFPPPQLDSEQHHSPTFDIDERSLLIGPSVLLNLVKQELFDVQHSKL